ncbi:MAG: molybdopterin molybdotransferase MoeA [Actinobacteria bacterium]|nr:molybdopterin molybdotransferase MoeA [Actinomycetota bacterium]
MRPLKAVRAEVLNSMRRLDTETIPYDQGVGRVLAEAVVSIEDVPQFANSAMDGFAVRAADVSEPDAVLEVVADLPAGQVASVSLGEGQAIRIMTGAPMPDGADTVVRVEDTAAEGDKVRIHTVAAEGNYVREAGGDVRAGQVVFDPGLRMGPVHVGVLATLGVVEPLVSRRPRVGVMSTGDELAPPATQDLAPGMIRDSNRPMLVGLLEDAGAEVIDYGRIADDADELRAALGRAAVETDAIVTSGGVSMGDYDVTKLVLRDEAGVDFITVAMKPGKPLAFGQLGGAPFFGLPGNPVSVVVSFEQFVRPALLTMQGASAVLRPQMTVAAGERLVTDPAKTVFIRVRLEGDGAALRATQAGGQASNILSVAAVADAFAVVPIGVETIDEGEPVLIELFRSPETREHRHDV